MKKIKLQADGVRITGPKVDGSYSVTFSTGEYMQAVIAELVKIPQNTAIELEIAYGKES